MAGRVSWKTDSYATDATILRHISRRTSLKFIASRRESRSIGIDVGLGYKTKEVNEDENPNARCGLRKLKLLGKIRVPRKNLTARKQGRGWDFIQRGHK